jgi:hypothetical protein
MCPCDLSREHVCDSCAKGIEDLYKALLRAEENDWDSQRDLRGQVATIGLKANIVIYRLTNGTRQYA